MNGRTARPGDAANLPFKAPPPIFHARCLACWVMLAVALLVAASFLTLDLQWGSFFSLQSMQRMGRFIGELLAPSTDATFLGRLVVASAETLAMSALGTLLAAAFGLLLALPASRTHADDRAPARSPTRLLLNALRSIPELVWAALLIVSAGLGPFAGTLALAMHTTGVLGRLFAEAIENAPPVPGFALRAQGVGEGRVFLYATLPQIVPQLLSYTLYRWENNIRAAAVLGVVGAGGLGQMLSFHMGLFQMSETSSILIAMILLVAMVDLGSYFTRRALSR
ncbi:MAG: phosphonate ABC transporter, permease protein PhnE [Burkholderiales bacterium]|jgi:phosphonate transport system permease protein|nr:phosphonate ABC transporter, permease protein PhnE [Burkholderiales bacterium]